MLRDQRRYPAGDIRANACFTSIKHQMLGLDDHEEKGDEHVAFENEIGIDDGASTAASNTILDDTKKQLEDLQLRTIYTLVLPLTPTFAPLN